MDWNRSNTLALAAPSCTQCRGLGMKTGKAKGNPCNCVLRGIFRACFARFRYCCDKDKGACRTSLEANPGRLRKNIWSRKDEEFVADFCLVSRRALSDFEYRIFRYHFLLGADWRLCCRRLNLDRGNFFHAVYRIEQRLGRVFQELQPYSLFPLDEYFGGTKEPSRPVPVDPADWRATPVRPPLMPRPAEKEDHQLELLEVA